MGTLKLEKRLARIVKEIGIHQIIMKQLMSKLEIFAHLNMASFVDNSELT